MFLCAKILPPKGHQKYRHISKFPFFLESREDFINYIRILRSEYTFARLPNDYLITKRPLPTDPLKLQLKTQVSFPIEDKATAQQLLEEILSVY